MYPINPISFEKPLHLELIEHETISSAKRTLTHKNDYLGYSQK